MPRDLTIADRLRRWGQPVREIDGWRTRGSDNFDPAGVIDHHTAGAATGNAPSLGVCINGRSDLPGPLCQILRARDRTCLVIAAGKANHGGKGAHGGISGNSRFFGLEVENRGTSAEPWSRQDLDDICTNAALIEGRIDPKMICRHGEYATPAGRKTDTHLHDSGITPDGNWLRQRTREILAAGPNPQHEEDDDMRWRFTYTNDPNNPNDDGIYLLIETPTGFRRQHITDGLDIWSKITKDLGPVSKAFWDQLEPD